MMKRFLLYTNISLVVLLSAGCVSSTNQRMEPSNITPIVPVTVEFTSTLIVISPSATLYPTQTHAPLLSTPSLTLTPLPVLREAQEIKAKLFELLQNNGGCKLPCLLGHTPKTVTIPEMNHFYNQFGLTDMEDLHITRSSLSNRKWGGVNFYLRYKGDMFIDLGISAYQSNGQIEMLGVGVFVQEHRDSYYTLRWDSDYAETMKYYLLPQILTNYGAPTQVLLLTYRDDQQRPDITTSPPFFLVLLYPNQGFYVKYEMKRILSGANFLGCPSESFVNIVVWSPEDDEIFERVVEPTINGPYLRDYKPVEESTLMTAEEFFQVFSNPGFTECLETPIETWPNP